MLPALRIAVSKPQMRLPDKERDHMKQLLLILLFAVVCFNPETRLVFSSNGERTVTVIRQESPDKYSVLETVKTAPGARTMALDLKTHKTAWQHFCFWVSPKTERTINFGGNDEKATLAVMECGAHITNGPERP